MIPHFHRTNASIALFLAAAPKVPFLTPAQILLRREINESVALKNMHEKVCMHFRKRYENICRTFGLSSPPPPPPCIVETIPGLYKIWKCALRGLQGTISHSNSTEQNQTGQNRTSSAPNWTRQIRRRARTEEAWQGQKSGWILPIHDTLTGTILTYVCLTSTPASCTQCLGQQGPGWVCRKPS